MEINGTYDLTKKRNVFLACDCWSLDHDYVSARILCNENYTCPQNIVDFAVFGKGKLKEDGLFLAVVASGERLSIFADSTTSQWVLYYTVKNGILFYSSSLKSLLKNSGVDRKIDLVAAKSFLNNGIVLGDRTLIDGINKLDVHEMLTVKNGKIKKIKIKYTKIGDSKNGLINTFRKSAEKFTGGSKQVFMPLSGGYDSNLILDTLTKNNHDINAFTIGGAVMKNEVPIVKKHLEDYKNVKLHTAIADTDLLKKLPEIIWRLDGYVYERGIFLQYLLSSIAKKHGADSMICGECSDEHQHLLYAKEMMWRAKQKDGFLYHFDWMLDPYTQGNFVVLKKSALMLNSFGIKGCYPFATKKFTDVATDFGKYNLSDKKYFIGELKGELPQKLYDSLVHAGGSTSIESIISKNDAEKIKRIVADSSLINKIKSETPKLRVSFKQDFHELYLSQKGRVNFKIVLGHFKCLIKKILNKLRIYSERTVELKESFETDIKSYYLILFSELFLSEKFNDYMENGLIQ